MDNPTADRHLEAPIEVILEKWPKVSRVFISNRMGCIGCSFAKFHTLHEACEIYQLDEGNIVGKVKDLLLLDEK